MASTSSLGSHYTFGSNFSGPFTLVVGLLDWDHIAFKFKFTLELDCYGTLIDMSEGNDGIYLLFSSSFYLCTGSSFVAKNSTYLYVYDIMTDQTLSSPISLDVFLVGPFFIDASISRLISINTNVINTGTSTTVSTSYITSQLVSNGILG
ncbi:unnamed protein product [Rotaria magnacalcarata]